MKLAIATAAAAVLLAGASARANFIAIYTGNAGNVYSYTLRFTVDQPGEVLRNGDKVTIYDVAPAANFNHTTAPAGTTFAVAALGSTPALLTGAAGLVDSPSILNVTYTYTGATLAVATDFVGGQIFTDGDFTALRVGQGSGSTATNFANPAAQGENASIRAVLVPQSTSGGNPPEPASLAILGLGGAALMFRRRKA